ncbi:porin family protein [uncultured Winogradskyella sp.]|uniref:porin family protein n=1 Tax=uncultured Winogradskyella sp. TaxID=395353 RepID=UPI0026065D51|nr:porin family protein [uncultured Winogradskyella sp.]
MKKYLFALVLVTFTTVCMSQEIRYGVRGALNISNLDFDPDADFANQHRNGFAFGGFVDFGFTDKVSLLTGLQWSAEGGKDESIRADYIKMPILLRFSLSDRFILGVGPQAALKTWKDRDGFATFTASGVVGLEYMITDELFIDARATYGFSNILDQDFTDDKAKNHVLQFGFGIKI